MPSSAMARWTMISTKRTGTMMTSPDPRGDPGRPAPPHGAGPDNRGPYNTATGLGDTGRITSKKAAARAAGMAGDARSMALAAITAAEMRGLTADECAAQLKLRPGSVRPRVTELANRGAVVPQKRADDRRKNLTRINGNGSAMIVWVLPLFQRRGGGG
jgi:hypothetical protein